MKRKQRRNRRRMLLVVLGSVSLVLVSSLLLIQAKGLSPLTHSMKSAPLSVGTVTEYQISTPHSEPVGITSGSDGNLWFTESHGNNIGQITTTGQVQISLLPALPNGSCLPNSIVQGSDGNLWFTEYYQIGQITPLGTLHEYALPDSNNLPDTITAGPDSNLWFTEYTGNKIARITVS